MSKTPDLTIFLLSDQVVARADYAGRERPRRTAFRGLPRSPEATSLAALESLLEDAGPVGRHVLVLNTEIWSQIISLPAASVTGVRQPELHQALRFEVETLTGIDAEQAQLGITDVTPRRRRGPGAERMFWLNVVATEQVRTIVDLMRAHGARAVDLAHPMGMAAAPTGKNCWRLEVWNNQVAWIHNGKLQKIQSRGSNWGEELQSRLDDPAIARQGSIIVSSASAVEGIDRGGVPLLDLSESDSLATWLDQTADKASDRSSRPLIQLEKQKRESGRGLVFKLVAAAIVLLFCGGHWWWLDQQQQKLERDTEALKRPALAKQQYDAELAEVLNQRATVDQEAARMQYQVKRVEFLFKAQTGRLKRLLAMLSEFRTEDLVIQAIEHDPNGLVVRGISLNSYSAPLMANRLREPAQPLGWKIHAATQIGEQKMTNGGPWDFSILFEDIGPGLTPISDTAPITTASKPSRP